MSKQNGTVEGVAPSWRKLRDDCLAEMVERKQAPLEAKTRGQAVYIRAVETSVVTLCTGPAGTGKTYVPVALAAGLLRAGRVRKLILTRPLVTCSGRKGPGVGFLPGDLAAKVGPHMRPMLDVLERFFTRAELARRVEDESVELIALDYMRGLSIDDAVVVADEMQNCDRDQMLMLLTRVGQNTKLVVSGDETQTDLPRSEGDTLTFAADRLFGIEGVSVVRLGEDDIVRNGMIREIIRNWNR